jgi:hypothetical protein
MAIGLVSSCLVAVIRSKCPGALLLMLFFLDVSDGFRCDLKSDKPPKKGYQVDQTLIYEGQENLSRIWGGAV